MNISLSYNIEKHAMSRTIKEYTINNYIRSYAEQLESCCYPDDRTILLILLEKLHDCGVSIV